VKVTVVFFRYFFFSLFFLEIFVTDWTADPDRTGASAVGPQQTNVMTVTDKRNLSAHKYLRQNGATQGTLL
jgi:hypothetical protein